MKNLFSFKKQNLAGGTGPAPSAGRRKHGGLANFIVDHNKFIRNIVLVLVILNALCYPLVGVNYDLTVYLPSWAPSKVAIDKMKETFGYPGTGRLMITDVTIYDAKAYKKQIEQIDGVDQVIWADTAGGVQVYGSSGFIDYDDIKDYFLLKGDSMEPDADAAAPGETAGDGIRADAGEAAAGSIHTESGEAAAGSISTGAPPLGDAVMDITFKEGDTSRRTQRAIQEIEDLVGDRGDIVGMSPTHKFIEENVKKEMQKIMGIVVVLIFFILLFTTTSYFEPVLFLTVIGCAIVLNKGSNIFSGTISHITNNISDLLQLATSMDYSVFLMHAYEREREKGHDKEAALKAGLESTITTVLSSSLTTFCGFIVLVFMKFTIGRDMGVAMAKGIICSLLMVIFLMPSLLLSWSDLIDRTRHKPLLPGFHGFAVVVNRLSPFILVIGLLVAGPVYVAQGMNHFMYGADATSAGEGTTIHAAAQRIDARFGRSNLLVAIFPDEGALREKELVDELEDLDYVKKVMGLSAYLPDGVPEDILPASITEMFHKNGYARLLIYIKTKPESKASYQYTTEVSGIIRKHYPDNVYITGNTPATMDMQEILIPDYRLVNSLAMIAVYLVVAISFHSPIMPLAAMVPIMLAIYINMMIPYLQGKELIFVAYAVVSCVQLGSTIDYAILSTENYIHIRHNEPDKKKAAVMMTEMSFPSILTSGVILLVCGYVISFLSSIPVISEVGHLIGRGAVLSVFFVVMLMPILLRLIDVFLMTTWPERRKRVRGAIEMAAAEAGERRRRRHERIRNAMKRGRQSRTQESLTEAALPVRVPAGLKDKRHKGTDSRSNGCEMENYSRKRKGDSPFPKSGKIINMEDYRHDDEKGAGAEMRSRSAAAVGCGGLRPYDGAFGPGERIRRAGARLRR